MPEVRTAGVLKPSAGTYLWGYGNYFISSEDAYGVTIQGSGFAYSDYSIQNGVRCAGWIGTVGSNLGAGVTNGGSQIAHWSVSRYLAKTASGFNIDCGIKVWGEVVNGWGAYNNGSWAGTRDSPLARNTVNIWVPPLARAATPPAPTVTGSGNGRVVRCPAVSNGVTYRLMYSQKGGAWQVYTFFGGTVQPNTNISFGLVANSMYRFRYDVQGPDGVWVTGAVSRDQYTIPTNPSGLTASVASGSTAVNLSWSTNAYAATQIQLQRSNYSDFRLPTMVYQGAVKNSHVDRPPAGGQYYYRVRALSPYWVNTGWSNAATVRAIQPPARLTGFKRVAPWNSNAHTFTWVNNSTTAAPYSYIKVQKAPNSSGNDQWTSYTIPGNATSWTSPDNGYQVMKYRIYVGNAAGETFSGNSTFEYGRIQNPRNTGASVAKSVARATFSYTKAPFTYASAVISKEVQYSVSDNGTAWGAWATATYSDTGSVITASYTTAKIQFVRFRVRTTITGTTDKNDRVSDWVQSIPVITGFAPIAPTVSYNKNTKRVTINVPADDIGSAAGRTIYLYVDGVETNRWANQSGAARTLTVDNVIPSSRFTLQAAVGTTFYPNRVNSAVLVVDFDTTQVVIGDQRYHVFLIYENGTMVPCGVSTV